MCAAVFLSFFSGPAQAYASFANNFKRTFLFSNIFSGKFSHGYKIIQLGLLYVHIYVYIVYCENKQQLQYTQQSHVFLY